MNERDKIEILAFLKDNGLKAKASSAALKIYKSLSEDFKNELDSFILENALDTKSIEGIINFFYDRLNNVRITLPEPLVQDSSPANENMLSMVASRIAGKRDEDPGDPLEHAAAVAFAGFFGSFMSATLARGFLHTMEGTVPQGILPYMNEERVKIVAHLACAILFASYVVYHHYSMKKKEFEKRKLEKRLEETKKLLSNQPAANKPGALEGPYQRPPLDKTRRNRRRLPRS